MPLPDTEEGECISCRTVTDRERDTDTVCVRVCVGYSVAAIELSGTLTNAQEMHETVEQSGEDQTAYPPHVHFAIFSPNYVIGISYHGNRRFGV